MLLISTLVAGLLLSLTGLVFGAIATLALDWLSMPARWNGSRLPVDLVDDPSYDLAYDGWWCEDDWSQYPPVSGPGTAQDGLVYRWHPDGSARLQFLLTHERIEGNWPIVWQYIYGAQL